MTKFIRGAGGGGGGSQQQAAPVHVAVEAPDSLRSRAYANVIDLISEGEIGGLVNGLKSVYLDDTQVMNDDGSMNFNGVTLESRNGTQSQAYIPGFADVESEHSVGLEVKTTSSIVRTITNSSVNAARVTMAFPSLIDQNTSNGDVNGTTVQYKIQVQTAGGGYVDQMVGRENISLGSGTQIGTGRALYDASFSVSWNGDNPSGQSVSYSVEASKNGGAWYSVNTGSLSGTGAWFPLYDGDGNIYGFWPVYPSASTGFSLSLDGSAYQFRIVKTGGNGSLSISGSGTSGTSTITVSGKTTSRYERAHRIPLSGTGPWDIRVVRLTADSTSSSLQNKSYWSSYTEIIDTKLRYPNSALVGLRFDSSQFSAIPSRSYEMKLLKVQVPSNYDPITRVYTGSWDGTFQVAWTDNPAWCFYDLLTNERYGLGKFLQVGQVDKWSLYQIGKYCDELVPDGFGGYEPRFTCNVYIQSRQDAYKVVQDFASCFRSMAYWASGVVTFSQDSPADPVMLVANANVIDGTFTYSGSSSKVRHTVALVRWNDPEDMYRQKVEYVEDRDGIDRYGYIQTDVTAFACTSRGQANRIGRWILFTERLETESVSFKTGMEGAIALPGQVIKVADTERAGARQGGRIHSATTGSVTVDAAPTGAVGGTLYVVAPDGTVMQSTVTGVSGTVLTVSPALPQVAQANAIWVLSTTTVAAQTFRVVSVAEAAPGEYEITALAHTPGKYGAVEYGLTLETRSISNLTAPPDSPQNVVISEALYQTTSEIKTKIAISWDPVPNATDYSVTYKVDNNNWVKMPQTGSCSVDLRDMPNGAYTVKVVALNSIGRQSLPSTATKTILGKLAPPANVQNFSLVPVGGMAMLSWDRAEDLDVLVGGYIRIRHTPLTTGQDWSNAIDIMPALAGTDMHATAPLLTGTYMAKFVDSSGFQSTTAAEIITTIPQAQALNVVSTVTESPTFPGTKTNVLVDGTLGGLSLTSTSTSGEYIFSNTVDLGNVYTSQVTLNVIAHAFDRNDYWDARVENIDTWTDVDGSLIDDCNVAIYMRTTNDNPSGSPTWTDWKPFFVSSYTARAFQFKAVFSTTTAGHTTTISTLQATVDMPDRVDAQNGLVSGAGSYHVTFTSPFWTTPAIGITANAMASGDYYTISGNSASGFDIIFKNSSGTAVSRTFDVMAKGYGRRV